ncbi:MAG: serine hydroxymethyltransferase, partial [Raoultibacter sp.]
GIRVGSAAATTRGFTAEDFYEVGQLIAATVFAAEDTTKLAAIKAQVTALLAAHPLYPEYDY